MYSPSWALKKKNLNFILTQNTVDRNRSARDARSHLHVSGVHVTHEVQSIKVIASPLCGFFDSHTISIANAAFNRADAKSKTREWTHCTISYCNSLDANRHWHFIEPAIRQSASIGHFARETFQMCSNTLWNIENRPQIGHPNKLLVHTANGNRISESNLIFEFSAIFPFYFRWLLWINEKTYDCRRLGMGMVARYRCAALVARGDDIESDVRGCRDCTRCPVNCNRSGTMQNYEGRSVRCVSSAAHDGTCRLHRHMLATT